MVVPAGHRVGTPRVPGEEPVGFATLSDAHWSLSGEVVLMTLLGGMGTFAGPVIGAFTIIGLQNFLADRVGRHEMPEALEIRESLPKTPVGKLSRKELSDEEKAKSA